MINLDTDATTVEANDFVMAKNMADTLTRHYPKHLWAVTCEGATGIATVRNLALSGKWGCIIKLKQLYSASELDRQMVQAGGEILERYRLARGALNVDHYGALPTDFAGHFTADK